MLPGIYLSWYWFLVQYAPCTAGQSVLFPSLMPHQSQRTHQLPLPLLLSRLIASAYIVAIRTNLHCRYSAIVLKPWVQHPTRLNSSQCLWCLFLYYSQAVMVDQTVYLSGCIGLDPTTANLVSGGIEPEADQVCTPQSNLFTMSRTIFAQSSSIISQI